MPEATIESLDHEGRGIARVDGKAVFVEGALPGERVRYHTLRARPRYEQAEVSEVLRPSALRVSPRCEYFGVCGGCSMQHVDARAQPAIKQRVLEDALWHIGRLRPQVMHAAIEGQAWAYRYRARLSVRVVPSKGGVLIGFHQRRSSYIADMRHCAVLPATVLTMLPTLHELVAALSIADRVPQIEVAVGSTVRCWYFATCCHSLRPTGRA